MTRLEWMLSVVSDHGRSVWADDVAILRAAIPAIAGMSEWMIETLYSRFSEEEYCAGWMGGGPNDGPQVESFAAWLAEEIDA